MIAVDPLLVVGAVVYLATFVAVALFGLLLSHAIVRALFADRRDDRARARAPASAEVGGAGWAPEWSGDWPRPE